MFWLSANHLISVYIQFLWLDDYIQTLNEPWVSIFLDYTLGCHFFNVTAESLKPWQKWCQTYLTLIISNDIATKVVIGCQYEIGGI